jgi:AcrR family transcriptional regulator
MRQKTDEKRQQILGVASTLFLKHGFDSVSMSQIAAKVGGSKSTLYSYFDNKDELFLEVVLSGIRTMVATTKAALEPHLSLKEKLHQFGMRHLTFVLGEDTIALRRIIIATSPHSAMGRQAYHKIMHESWQHVTDLIAEAMQRGELIRADASQAAHHFKSLIENDLVDRRLLSILKNVPAPAIAASVETGLAVFWRFYGHD